MGVSKNSGTPKWMVKIMVPNPIKMDASLGQKKTYFWFNTHMEIICHTKNGQKGSPAPSIVPGLRPTPGWCPSIHSSWAASGTRQHEASSHGNPRNAGETHGTCRPTTCTRSRGSKCLASCATRCRSVSCWYGIFHSSFKKKKVSLLN